MATIQPDKDRATYFEYMKDDGSSLLRTKPDGSIWGLTEDKAPRKARKGERQYYEFIHTLMSSKFRYKIEKLFEESGDGTSFNELLENKLDCEGLVKAFQQAGRYKNVQQEDGSWMQIEQPEDQWEATIDVLLTVTEKDQKYFQTCFADRFMNSKYNRIKYMEEKNASYPFITNKEGAAKFVHYTIQPQDFEPLPF